MRPALALLALTLAGALGCGNEEPQPGSPWPVEPVLEGLFPDVTSAYGLGGPQAVDPGYDAQGCGLVRFMTAGASVVDVDGDGWLDVFVPRLGLPDRLMRNVEGRTFVEIGPAWGVANPDDTSSGTFFDMDGDGDLDLYTTGAAGARLYRHEGDGYVEVPDAGGATLPVVDGCAAAFGAAVGDVDADGDLDLFTAAWEDRPGSRLFVNDGTGRFTDATSAWGLDALDEAAMLVPTPVDVDGDRDLDYLAIADFADTRIYRQAGLQFEDVTGTSTLARVRDGMGVDLGDVNGDGHLDLFTSGICLPGRRGCRDVTGWTGNHLFLGDGAGGFVDTTTVAGVEDARWAWGAAFWDPDGDGDLDLLVTSGYDVFLDFQDTPLRAFENDGTGRFVDRAVDWGLDDERGQTRAVIPFDVDRDGDEDLLIVRHGGPPSLRLNQLVSGGAPVVVRVPGAAAYGTRVRLIGADGAQIGLLGGHSRYLSHGPREVRFAAPGLPPYRVEVDGLGGWSYPALEVSTVGPEPVVMGAPTRE